MKIILELNEDLEEDEVILRCKKFDTTVQKIQTAISNINKLNQKFTFYKDNTEFYLSIDEILFFETSDGCISAHTATDVYQTKYKLYELEEMLPDCFIRVSKSTILNVNHIISIDRNLTASSIVHFQKSYKQVYVSRHYFKALKMLLESKR